MSICTYICPRHIHIYIYIYICDHIWVICPIRILYNGTMNMYSMCVYIYRERDVITDGLYILYRHYMCDYVCIACIGISNAYIVVTVSCDILINSTHV